MFGRIPQWTCLLGGFQLPVQSPYLLLVCSDCLYSRYSISSISPYREKLGNGHFCLLLMYRAWGYSSRVCMCRGVPVSIKKCLFDFYNKWDSLMEVPLINSANLFGSLFLGC